VDRTKGAGTVDGSDDPGIPVADAIEYLRDELEAALRKGAGRPVQFGVSDVTLTMNVVAGKSKDAGGPGLRRVPDLRCFPRYVIDGVGTHGL
jgi:Trypsin-co-occurring domain 2